MDIASFINANSKVIIIVGIIIVIILIGFVAQQTKIGKKVLFKDQKDGNKEDKKEEIKKEDLNKPLIEKKENIPSILAGMNEKPIKTDIFDNIKTNFNENGLSITDINENPQMSEQELAMTEDLYATFGDQPEEKEETSKIEDNLKIEDVSDTNDFKIMEVEKNEDGQVIAPTEEEMEKLTQPIESVTIDESNIQNVEENKTEEQEENKTEEQEENQENEETISKEYADEIDKIVDNTFVLNDATEEANQNMEDSSNDNDEEDETNDFDFEATTSLKLDEINEQIRNLKLEDLDNNEDEEYEKEQKKEKQNKNISIKSIDEIIEEKNNSQN